ncbi:hypothetical protein P7C73_g1994, partial [Tremellales sp. Uapishka_1]
MNRLLYSICGMGDYYDDEPDRYAHPYKYPFQPLQWYDERNLSIHPDFRGQGGVLLIASDFVGFKIPFLYLQQWSYLLPNMITYYSYNASPYIQFYDDDIENSRILYLFLSYLVAFPKDAAVLEYKTLLAFAARYQCPYLVHSLLSHLRATLHKRISDFPELFIVAADYNDVELASKIVRYSAMNFHVKWGWLNGGLDPSLQLPEWFGRVEKNYLAALLGCLQKGVERWRREEEFRRLLRISQAAQLWF